MDDAAAFLELSGGTKAVLHRGECFHVAHQSLCIRLRNDSIDDHQEASEAFARMRVLSNENDRNVRHYLLQFSRCLQAIVVPETGRPCCDLVTPLSLGLFIEPS
jgi:hypothetical protein